MFMFKTQAEEVHLLSWENNDDDDDYYYGIFTCVLFYNNTGDTYAL